MRKLAVLAVGVFIVACSDTPTETPTMDAPPVAFSGVSGDHAAIRFEGPNSCLLQNPVDGEIMLGSVASVTTNSETGRTQAICRGQLPNPTGRAVAERNVPCLFFADPATQVSATESQLTITPAGEVSAYCGFQSQPTNAYVEAGGVGYAAAQGAITVPLADVGGSVSGAIMDVGAACVSDGPLPDLTGKIALIVRGGCAVAVENRFDSKIPHAAAAGAIAAIVYNNFGDGVITMGGNPVGLPGVFVGSSSGIALQSETEATIGECSITGRSLVCQGNLAR